MAPNSNMHEYCVLIDELQTFDLLQLALYLVLECLCLHGDVLQELAGLVLLALIGVLLL